MKYSSIFGLLLALFPFVASAQNLQAFFTNLIVFINSTIIPFLIGVGFLIFVYNTIRYFVVGGANEDSQEKARMFATYSVLAMVLLVIFWGVVNMLSQSVGLQNCTQPNSDYITRGIGPNLPACP